MNKKLIIVAVVIALLSGAAYLLLMNNKNTATPEAPTVPVGGMVTERGVITCIPKVGTGPQTMECALGLRNTEGIYFGLRFLSDHDENFSLVSPDITVEITGNLIHEEFFGPDGNRYDTIGIIEIETISEIED